jgi:hypothetical protein
MKINKIDKALTDTEHRVKILIQKAHRLDQAIDNLRAKHGIDKTDRSKGKRIEAAIGPAAPGSGSGSAGAVIEAGAGPGTVQSQAEAEGGK